MTETKAETAEGGYLARYGIPFAVAVLVFYIFPLLTEAYALQLREFSAMMAETLLRATNLEVSRQGTILALPEMTFDIIPACSGSGMLRTLLFGGILWAGIHPRVTPVRKIIAVLLAAVIALFANGIRLTALLWVSYLRGEVVEEGLAHTMIGLSAFAVALPGFFMVTELLATNRQGLQDGQGVQSAEHDPADASMPSSQWLVFTLVLAGIAYLPVLSACLVAWKGAVYNPYDQFGYLFFIAGCAGWVWSWRSATADHTRMKSGCLLFAGASVVAVLSQLPGPNYYVMGVTLMVSLFALGLAYRNLAFALRCLPCQFVMVLSFPKVSEMINFLLHTNGMVVPLLVKGMLAGLAAFVFVRYGLPLQQNAVPVQPATRWAPLMTVCAAIAMAGMLYVARADHAVEMRSYVLPYLLGRQAEWEGRDIIDDQSAAFYQRGNVLNRYYTRDGEQVGVMIVPSDGKRKTIHTPEYCQMGLGWKPVESESIIFTSVSGKSARARKLLLENEETGVRRTFIYWFGDEHGVTIANYPQFLMADTWRKLFGRKTNWSLYVVWADNTNASAEKFLTCLPVIRPRS